MVVPSAHQIRKLTSPVLTAPVTRNRFCAHTGQQATVAGEPVKGAFLENGLAGQQVAFTDMGSECVLTAAGIALTRGGGTFEWVQTDANGMAIAWAGGAANVAGFITVAAVAGAELVEVHFWAAAAGIV